VVVAEVHIWAVQVTYGWERLAPGYCP